MSVCKFSCVCVYNRDDVLSEENEEKIGKNVGNLCEIVFALLFYL